MKETILLIAMFVMPNSWEDLIGHMDSVHEGKKPFYWNEEPFKCTLCDSSFLKDENTEMLKASVHEKRKPFQSFICGASFAQNAKLKSSWREKSLKCNSCGANFEQQFESAQSRFEFAVQRSYRVFLQWKLCYAVSTKGHLIVFFSILPKNVRKMSAPVG